MTYVVDVKKVTQKTLKGVKDSSGDWTYDTKLTVCQLLDNSGNLRATADITEVPLETIRIWQRSEWWPNVVEDMKRLKRMELNSRLSAIVSTALDKIEDRISNGDFVLNQKTGEVMRKPISLRDANQVAKDLLGQQIQMEKLDQHKVEVHTSTQDLLKSIAKEFANFNRKLKQGDATDIKFVEKTPERTSDAIHEKRTEGLQEGSSSVYEQA